MYMILWFMIAYCLLHCLVRCFIRQNKVKMIEMVFDLVERIEGNEPCPICLEEGSNVRLSCGHVFHKDCVNLWFHEQPTCPVCRHDYGGVILRIV